MGQRLARGHTASQWQSFNRLVLHWTSFLILLFKGKLEGQGCTPVLQKVVSCSVPSEYNTSMPTYREMTSGFQFRSLGRAKNLLRLHGRKKVQDPSLSCFGAPDVPVPLPTFPCLLLCLPSVAPLSPGLAPSMWVDGLPAQVMTLTSTRAFCDFPLPMGKIGTSQ